MPVVDNLDENANNTVMNDQPNEIVDETSEIVDETNQPSGVMTVTQVLLRSVRIVVFLLVSYFLASWVAKTIITHYSGVIKDTAVSAAFDDSGVIVDRAQGTVFDIGAWSYQSAFSGAVTALVFVLLIPFAYRVMSRAWHIVIEYATSPSTQFTLVRSSRPSPGRLFGKLRKRGKNEETEPVTAETTDETEPETIDEAEPVTTEDIKPVTVEETKPVTTETPETTDEAKPEVTDEAKAEATDKTTAEATDETETEPVAETKPTVHAQTPKVMRVNTDPAK